MMGCDICGSASLATSPRGYCAACELAWLRKHIGEIRREHAARIAELEASEAGWKRVASDYRAKIAELEQQVAYEQERNANNVACAETKIAELETENAQLREALEKIAGLDHDGSGYCGPRDACRSPSIAKETLCAPPPKSD